jgi:hypothetical protein
MRLRGRATTREEAAGHALEMTSTIKRGRAAEEEEGEAAGPMEASPPDHALVPLMRRLVAMIANPSKLLAALVEEFDELPRADGDYASIEARAVVYQRHELEGLDEAFQAISTAVATDLTSMAADRQSARVDATMLKATLYYWRVWEYVSAVCIDAVARIEKAAVEQPEPRTSSDWPSVLTKRRGSSISPSYEARTAESPNSSAKRARLTRQSNEFMIGWFIAHKTNPYPSATERVAIADRTGLTEQQVRNWFANMRKRHWKPNRPNGKKPRCLLDYVLRSHQPQS